MSRIFTWQEERRLTSNLVVHFKRVSYLVQPGPDTIPLGGKRVRILEREDGAVEIQHGDKLLPYSVFDKNPLVSQGAIVENKRLGAALSVIQTLQAERDGRRLASKGLTLRQKGRLRETRVQAGAAPAPTAFNERMAKVFESMKRIQTKHDAKQRERNRRSQERFRMKRRAALEAASIRPTVP